MELQKLQEIFEDLQNQYKEAETATRTSGELSLKILGALELAAKMVQQETEASNHEEEKSNGVKKTSKKSSKKDASV